MGDERITRVSASDRTRGRTDYELLSEFSDETIAEAVADDPDAAPIDLDWSKAEVMVPAGKVPISIRLDGDVLAFFREGGAGYQRRINAVLRSYMRAQRRADAKP